MWFGGWLNLYLSVLGLCFLVIGSLSSALATLIRFIRIRQGLKLPAGESQRKVDWAIALLAISGVFAWLGSSIYVSIFGLALPGLALLIIGVFLLWPVSVALAIWGRGAGRNVLLVGHGLIALCLLAILLMT